MMQMQQGAMMPQMMMQQSTQQVPLMNMLQMHANQTDQYGYMNAHVDQTSQFVPMDVHVMQPAQPPQPPEGPCSAGRGPEGVRGRAQPDDNDRVFAPVFRGFRDRLGCGNPC